MCRVAKIPMGGIVEVTCAIIEEILKGTINMKKLIAIAFATVSLAATAANLVLVGDSTLAPRRADAKHGSWGAALKPSLADGNGIINQAVGGRTVRTTKPVWAKNLTKISKGDFVIIQFGINDAGKKRFVDEAEFKKTMKEFASDVIAKGATPVICGPVANAGWTKKSKAGSAFQLAPSRRVYADYSKAVADELKIAFVDMTALTSAELAKIGKDAAIELFVGDTTKKGKPSFDTTHPSKAGAKRFAELFLAEVKAQNLPVATLFK
jgi:lysophospholipase L1-like esterase